jgi:hypothetical protein
MVFLKILVNQTGQNTGSLIKVPYSTVQQINECYWLEVLQLVL